MRPAGVALLPLLAVVLGGCAGVVPGVPRAGEIDVRALDAGTYPVDPLDYRTTFTHSPEAGTALAVLRLAGRVAATEELHPGLVRQTGAGPVTDTDALGELPASVSAPILSRNGMRFGFATTAANETGDILAGLRVLQFPTPDAATTAAEALTGAITRRGAGTAAAHTVSAHGNYLVSVSVEADDPVVRRMLTQYVISAQTTLLDTLDPLSDREILRLDYDPESVLRRTLHPGAAATPGFGADAALTPRGFLHLSPEPARWRTLFALSGTDLIGRVPDGAVVLRARDEASARTALDHAARTVTPTDPPAGVPGAFCAEMPGADVRERFSCGVRYGRYLAFVTSAQPVDARQRAAAQYALLVNSAWM